MNNKAIQRRAGRRAWVSRRQSILRKGGKKAYAIYKRNGLPEWHCNEGADLLVEKDGERDRCVAFVLKHDTDTPEKTGTFLGLGGSRFKAEQMIAAAKPGTKFISLERSTKFIECARPVFDMCAPGGTLKEEERNGLTVYDNGQTTVYPITAGEFAKQKLSEPVTKLWFDGMGTVTAPDLHAFLKGLRKQIPEDRPIPAVFTLLKGREESSQFKDIPGGVLAKRVRYLVRLCSQVGLRFHIKAFNSYKSDTGGPLQMMNICGLLSVAKRVRKRGTPARHWTEFDLESFRKLVTALQADRIAGFLDTDVVNVRRWLSGKSAPDRVAQVELRQMVAFGAANPPPSAIYIAVRNLANLIPKTKAGKQELVDAMTDEEAVRATVVFGKLAELSERLKAELSKR